MQSCELCQGSYGLKPSCRQHRTVAHIQILHHSHVAERSDQASTDRDTTFAKHTPVHTQQGYASITQR